MFVVNTQWNITFRDLSDIGIVLIILEMHCLNTYYA
jgi:hypothetical protein